MVEYTDKPERYTPTIYNKRPPTLREVQAHAEFDPVDRQRGIFPELSSTIAFMNTEDHMRLSQQDLKIITIMTYHIHRAVIIVAVNAVVSDDIQLTT